MAYEQHQAYLKLFDPAQSPLYLRILAQRAGACLDATDAGSYLDLGCAAGHSTLALAPLYPAVTFLGVDFNAGHIADARFEANRLGLGNALYIEADFRCLPGDLPPADLLVVRGIYSWLATDVKAALEHVAGACATPKALLRLHYSVLPGALLRESFAVVLRAAGGSSLSPDQGRGVAQLLKDQAPILQNQLSACAAQMAHLQGLSDELWLHDLLNEDFDAEYAQSVMQRFAAQGYCFAASTHMERNLPALLVNPPIQPLLRDWHSPAAQTLLDVVTFNSGRSDLFVRGAMPDFAAGTYPPDTRFGVIVPTKDLFAEVPTVNGILRYENTRLRGLLVAIHDRAQTVAELSAAFPDLSPLALRDWLDLLWAGVKISPFLPPDAVVAIDRDRLRRLNRERIAWAIEDLNPNTRVPLLAAEYGNCLVAGWFEALVLSQFSSRHKRSTQMSMLKRIHAAGIGFRGPDGSAAPDQLMALHVELERLEINYISRMSYWGIDV